MKSTVDTMMENCETTEEKSYSFRFSTTNDCLCPTEEQLNRIPYLRTLLEHPDEVSINLKSVCSPLTDTLNFNADTIKTNLDQNSNTVLLMYIYW